MNFDLSALLLVALVVAGAIIAIDTARRKAARGRSGEGADVKESVLGSYARSYFPVILIVLLIRAFLIEPFRIPSDSMMPGLVDGDFIFVNKFSYGLRLPLLNTKFVSIGDPQRGDVIVFRSPADPSINLIKRLVGLPGDHVEVHDNRVVINGKPIALQADGSYPGGYRFAAAELGIEHFGDSQHIVMFADAHSATDFDGVVPAGHYFFMGDNRNDSEDSRFPRVGFVPQDNLIGHAVRIWMNWRIPGWPDWQRVGLRIQ
ncbi:MAG TPA: signal peptidase I [Steroidobacteraceae bacterium]|jgi:signal peptidase I